MKGKKSLRLITLIIFTSIVFSQVVPTSASVITSASSTTVSNFELKSYAEFSDYNEMYIIKPSQIASITNNGGNYGSSTIDKLNDGDLATFWETSKPNSTTFKNEVVVTFTENVDINRIAYATRQDGARPKGFPTKFEIYGNIDGSNIYSLAAVGSSSETGNMVEIKFAKTTFKKLKFVFVEAYVSWASASELWFYKEDLVLDTMKGLFTDRTHSALSSSYTTLSQITDLETSLTNHPLRNRFLSDITDAKKIIANPAIFNRYTITAEQKVCPSVKLGAFPGLNQYQPTGLYALPGQTVKVYVEADMKGPMPSITFSQNQGSWNNFQRSYSLLPGLNTFVVPEIYSAEWSVPVKKGGPIYINNYYSSSEQPVAPKIRIEGATPFPYFKEGGDEQSFINELSDYNAKLDADNAAGTSQVLDLVEVYANNMLLTTTAKGAVAAYITNTVTVKPSETTAFWSEFMMEQCRLAGMDGSAPVHDPTNIKDNIRLMQPYGYMYAWGNHIGVQGDVKAIMLIPEKVKSGSWGFAHELGHKLDNAAAGARTWGEITNNVQSANMQRLWEGRCRRIPYEVDVYPNVAPNARIAPYNGGDYFENLAIFWQLQLYDNNYWAKLNKLYRERRPGAGDEQNKRELLMKYSSEVLNLNLGEYFKRHGWEAREAALAQMAAYPTPTKKIWYMNDSVTGYNGTGLPSTLAPKVTSGYNSETKKVTLNLAVDSNYTNDILGYEILKGGQVIGFTSNSSFNVTNEDVVNSGIYEVRVYDKKLNRAGAATINATDAKIILNSENITLKLNEAFNPLTNVGAKDYLGNSLDSQIKVVANNVNTAVVGKYKVTYALNGVQKSMNVNVVSNYNYLSDLNWTSATVGWGTIRKDKSIENRTLTTNNSGATMSFAKGVGTHANSTIIYNLAGVNYSYFESLVGVDKEAADPASITFEVWTDGKKVFDSGVMRTTSNLQYVKVPLDGVKELKLVVNDGGNGISSDHGDWLDSKLVLKEVINKDCNRDGKVDVMDMALVSTGYGSAAGQASYNETYDLNNDDIIDIFDLCIIAKDIR